MKSHQRKDIEDAKEKRLGWQSGALPPSIDALRKAIVALARRLWETWKSPTSSEEIISCTVITCGPNKVMHELRDRMPVILDEADWPKWLGEEPAMPDELYALLKSCRDDALKIWPVDNAVGNVRNKGPQLITPISPLLFGEQT